MWLCMYVQFVKKKNNDEIISEQNLGNKNKNHVKMGLDDKIESFVGSDQVIFLVISLFGVIFILGVVLNF